VTEPAIRVSDASKTFRIPHRQVSTLKERVLHPFQAAEFDELRAVDHLTFDIEEGEFFGIVGRNGSGKSTLLKCMAGIYDLDAGSIDVRGRLSPFIELGVGFNPDLTARDNVVINAIMLGLTRKQAKDRFDEIVRFAGLEEFLDLKLKNYSSGMQVRLGFSVAIQVDADILLVDEVLAVGDAAFQQKCFEQFHRLKDEGRTIVLVTHDMGAVERFCDRAMLIERGQPMEIGEPRHIGRRYNELNFGRLVHEEADGEQRYGDHGPAEITAAWCENAAGEKVAAIGQGEEVRVCIEVSFREALENPIFGCAVRNEARHTIHAFSSTWEHGPTGSFEAGTTAVVRIGFENRLGPSRYTISPSVARAGGGASALDLREDLTSLVVHANVITGAVVDPPHEFTVARQ
jgi:ABC-type polysaccharide/polyol phosphate transport system ATPase subunit